MLDAPFSSTERALEVLAEDGLVERADRRTHIVDSPRAGEAVRFALSYLQPDEALETLARANPAFELCGSDSQAVLVVSRRFAEPADEARLDRAIEQVRTFHPDRSIELVSKADLRERLLDDLSPRRRAQAMRVLSGGVDRSFPDRTHHGDVDAPGRGRLHPTLSMPSQRRLRELGRRHGLRRIVAFGSATRADFRPNSDVDLIVEPVPGHAPGLRERVDLMVDTERLLGRDVDLLVARCAGRRSPRGSSRRRWCSMTPRDEEILTSIAESTRRIDEHVDRAGSACVEDGMALDAITKRLEQIGELAKRLPRNCLGACRTSTGGA